MTKEELRETLSEHILKYGVLYKIGGALGELQGCDAYAEEIRKDGMWQTKYYGVSYWFKGITDNDIIDRVTITKRAFKEIINLWPLKIFKIIKSFHQIYACEGGLKSRELKLENFCPACQELIRVGIKLVKNEIIKDLVYCFAMFLQFSTSYRVRVQDGLGELNKANLKKSFLKELWRIKKIVLQREISEKKKIGLFLNLLFLWIIFNKKTAKDFLNELSIDKIKLDEADMYYCLRRSSYNFMGKGLNLRLIKAEIIDKEQNNLILGI